MFHHFELEDHVPPDVTLQYAWNSFERSKHCYEAIDEKISYDMQRKHEMRKAHKMQWSHEMQDWLQLTC